MSRRSKSRRARREWWITHNLPMLLCQLMLLVALLAIPIYENIALWLPASR